MHLLLLDTTKAKQSHLVFDCGRSEGEIEYVTSRKSFLLCVGFHTDILKGEAEAALQYRPYLPPNPSPANVLERNGDGNGNDSPWPHPLSPSYLAPPIGHTISHPAVFGQTVPVSQPAYAVNFSTAGYTSAAPLSVLTPRTDTTLFDNLTPQGSLPTAKVPENLLCDNTSKDEWWPSSPHNTSSQLGFNWSSSNQNPTCELTTAQTLLTLPEIFAAPPQNVINDL